jgi:hypothetical protein
MANLGDRSGRPPDIDIRWAIVTAFHHEIVNELGINCDKIDT